MAGIGDLLGGVAAGGTAMIIAKDKKAEREDRKARLARSGGGYSGSEAVADDEKNRVGLEGREMETGEQKAEREFTMANGGAVPTQDDIDAVANYADGGSIKAHGDLYAAAADKSAEDKTKRRKKLDEEIDKASFYANGGVIAGPRGAVVRGRRGRGAVAYADGGLIAGAKKPALKGVNAKPAPQSPRDQGKRQPSAPMIGVRADADPAVGDFQTEVQVAAAEGTALMADGGAVPGYATGGLLFGSYIPGGYVQHGSYTQTSDPLWHMECHRDFGKKKG